MARIAERHAVVSTGWSCFFGLSVLWRAGGPADGPQLLAPPTGSKGSGILALRTYTPSSAPRGLLLRQQPRNRERPGVRARVRLVGGNWLVWWVGVPASLASVWKQ
jgi:hypothetical protein